MPNPLEQLHFPVMCNYPECGQGPFKNAIEVDEHICEDHITEAVWTFAFENMKELSE